MDDDRFDLEALRSDPKALAHALFECVHAVNALPEDPRGSGEYAKLMFVIGWATAVLANGGPDA